MTTNRRRMTDDDLGRRLTAYAQLRLSPTPEAAARMRARVVDAARAAATAPVTAPAPIPFAAYRARLSGRSRAFAALMAAALSVLLVAGVAFASGPGDPLYSVRLWAETLGLPSESAARTDAEVDRLDARVDEAVRASENGNGRAVSAALEAYRDILDDAETSAAQGDSQNDRLEAALGRHRIVLSTLLDLVPDQARDAIQNAIDRSEEATERFEAKRGNKGGGTPNEHANQGGPDDHGGGAGDKPRHPNRSRNSHGGGKPRD